MDRGQGPSTSSPSVPPPPLRDPDGVSQQDLRDPATEEAIDGPLPMIWKEEQLPKLRRNHEVM